MARSISKMTEIHPDAQLGEDVVIGPFCVIGPHVKLGDRCQLDSHVVLTGHTTIGSENRFHPGVVIGGEPQDVSWKDAPTRIEIGNGNSFREGVTVHRAAEKEDHVTTVGNHNLIMANAHIAHNCWIGNHTILVNGVLLGGHVHVHDKAIVSGNSVVHHFSTLGTLSFVSGGCRVPHDVPPFMLTAGSDNPQIRTINTIGLQRADVPPETIQLIKRAFRLLYREHIPVGNVRETMMETLDSVIPIELATLLNFVEAQTEGWMGRQREQKKHAPPKDAKSQSNDQSNNDPNNDQDLDSDEDRKAS